MKNKKHEVRYENENGKLRSYSVPIGEGKLEPYLLPGWVPLWITENGKDVLLMLSPSLMRLYDRVLAGGEESDGEELPLTY